MVVFPSREAVQKQTCDIPLPRHYLHEMAGESELQWMGLAIAYSLPDPCYCRLCQSVQPQSPSQTGLARPFNTSLSHGMTVVVGKSMTTALAATTSVPTVSADTELTWCRLLYGGLYKHQPCRWPAYHCSGR